MEENVNQTEKEMAENENRIRREKKWQKCKLGTDRKDPGTDRTAGGRAERKGSLE